MQLTDHLPAGDPDDVRKLAKGGGRLAKTAFQNPVHDFYLTNPIARASKVMAECSAMFSSGMLQAAE